MSWHLATLTGRIRKTTWLWHGEWTKAIRGLSPEARLCSQAPVECTRCGHTWVRQEVDGLYSPPNVCRCGCSNVRIGGVTHTFIPRHCAVVYGEETA